MAQPPTNYNPPARNLAQLIASLGPQSNLAAQSVVDPRALAAGIKPSFAVLTFKGKTWGIRHRGVTSQLLQRDERGTIVGAIPTVDVIIVKSATAISKNFYLERYKEGDFNQPDCWSTNGIKPDPAAPKIQNPTCRGCKWDAFGSRRMDDGRNAKACSDSKRVAVVPAADLKNEAFGGPMLLRLPPSAFNALSELEVQLHMQGYRYFALVMRLSFDHAVAYPKIMFTPIRVLNDHEMTEVIELQKSDQVERILNEELIEVTADPRQPDPQEETSAPAEMDKTVREQPVRPEGVEAAGFRTQASAQAFNTVPPPAAAMAQVFTPQTTNGAGQAQAETAEERIAKLEAALAAATKGKPGRKRSTPVTPGGVQVQPPAQAVVPADQPFTAHAGGEPNGAPEGDEDEGDTPVDLDDRVDKLLKS